MRRVNLLPPEERQRGLSGLSENALGGLIIAAAALVILVAGISLYSLIRLNSLDGTIADLDESILQRTDQVQELQPYAELEGDIASKQPVADGVVRTRFPWDEFLRQLSFVIPAATTLETLTAEASPVDIDASVGEELDPPGAVTFVGFSQPDYTNVADFVLQMNTIRFLSNSELDRAELDRTTFAEEALDFEVSSQLVTVVGERESEVRLESGEPATETQYGAGDQAAIAGPDAAPEAQ
ncbi:Fimbrial assembly protein (PilN) [Rubrobacter radiotolerans]|uniref:Fimbrial assembly protein (PilN) n=1 Tax=Rubrobacter radiotolerans TaxID=42256 RepID=A0A023X3X4_RUBRA|nr:PilN domain-containing protein [Rubrobacter radiotolerans]AHY46754.1 Fimbrial assembly protein (PilN) [Rubrobacter radiotolerans]MDX5894161.1 PilN domain-containing protein [Rubrobacter radiotolerans]SMC05344.1 type IV pilus assembly protein PilN [Rubrobacter radiotolerans DSM 5868]